MKYWDQVLQLELRVKMQIIKAMSWIYQPRLVAKPKEFIHQVSEKETLWVRKIVPVDQA